MRQHASCRSTLERRSTSPTARVENTYENRIKIAAVVRRLRPRVVILPYWTGRHPDHYTSSTLGYEACFLAGLSKVDTGDAPYRPFKIVYASLYADVRPSFVVDISDHVEARFAALMAYRSQYSNQDSGGSLFVPEEEIQERMLAMARHYGLLAGVRYAEPFVQKEIGLVGRSDADSCAIDLEFLSLRVRSALIKRFGTGRSEP